MRRVLKAEGVKATKGALEVYLRAEVGATVRFVKVRVPWRMLNEQYEEVSNHMAVEATEKMKDDQAQPWLPLETWE